MSAQCDASAAAAAAALGLQRAGECGAVLCAARDTASVSAALAACGWRKRGKSTCRYLDGSGRMAVHVSRAAAATLRRSAGDLGAAPCAADLVGCAYVAGLRVGSAACGGNRGPQCTAAFHDLRKAPRPARARGTRFTFAELFAGVGGFSVGLGALGGDCVFASELDAHACRTFLANHGFAPCGDISEIDAADVPDHDFLTGGFPCQSFSRAGERRGFDDPRGELFFEVARILTAKRPRGFILENVADILVLDGGFARAVVLAALEAAGYRVDVRVVNALLLLPQHRERAFFVGVRVDVFSGPYAWPPLAPIRARCASDGEFGRRCPCRRTVGVGRSPAVGAILVDGGAVDRQLTERQWANICGKTADARVRRLAWLRGAARTLMSNYANGYKQHSEFVAVDGAPPRFYSRREAARIQGFPDAFAVDLAFGTSGGVAGGGRTRHGRAIADDEGANRFYAQIGNAVCPPIVAALAAPLIAAILPGALPADEAPSDAVAPAAFRLLDAAGQPASAGFEGPLPCAPRPAGLAKNGP